MNLRNQFFELMEEEGKEINYDIVNVEFHQNGAVESIFITDGFEDTSIVGQEGYKTYSAYEAIDFIKSCNGFISK